jgi:hypothetical protein
MGVASRWASRGEDFWGVEGETTVKGRENHTACSWLLRRRRMIFKMKVISKE